MIERAKPSGKETTRRKWAQQLWEERRSHMESVPFPQHAYALPGRRDRVVCTNTGQLPSSVELAMSTTSNGAKIYQVKTTCVNCGTTFVLSSRSYRFPERYFWTATS